MVVQQTVENHKW